MLEILEYQAVVQESEDDEDDTYCHDCHGDVVDVEMDPAKGFLTSCCSVDRILSVLVEGER